MSTTTIPANAVGSKYSRPYSIYEMFVFLFCFLPSFKSSNEKKGVTFGMFNDEI